METVRSLEYKLNDIIDNEFEKEFYNIDDRLVLECCDGILRMDNIEKYLITREQFLKNKMAILGEKISKRHKTVKVLLVAAIIAALVTVFALGYAQVKYDIFHFSDHSTVRFSSANDVKVYDLKVGYVPEGFTCSGKNYLKTTWTEEYSNGDLCFNIVKEAISQERDINTEFSESKIINIDGLDYIVYGEDVHGRGILWISNNYLYSLAGNLKEDELLKIAKSVS